MFLKITTKKDRFVFIVESNGMLKPEEIVRNSFIVN